MRLKENIAVRKIGHDFILISPDLGMLDMTKVCTLSETAASIWDEFSASEFEEEEVVLFMLLNYEVGQELAQKDVRRILDQFRTEGLLNN